MLPTGNPSARAIRQANREYRSMNMQQSTADMPIEAHEEPSEMADPNLPSENIKSNKNMSGANNKVSEEIEVSDQQLEGAGAKAGAGDIVFDNNASAGALEGARTSADALRRHHTLEELAKQVAEAIASKIPPTPTVSLSFKPPIADPKPQTGRPATVWPVVDLTADNSSASGEHPDPDPAQGQEPIVVSRPLTEVKKEGGGHYESPNPPSPPFILREPTPPALYPKYVKQQKSPSPLLHLTPESMYYSMKENIPPVWQDQWEQLEDNGPEPKPQQEQPRPASRARQSLTMDHEYHGHPTASIKDPAPLKENNGPRQNQEPAGKFFNNQPHSLLSSTESELLKLAEELRMAKQDQDLKAREHDIESREQRQQIHELMRVVQGLQEDRKNSDLGGTSQSKGTLSPEIKSKSEGESAKVGLNQLKIPAFVPMEGLFRSRDYCRSLLDFYLQNNHLNPVQQVAFLVATFKNSSPAFTFWCRWRPALLELTIIEAHPAILAVSSGHTLADQVSLYAQSSTSDASTNTSTGKAFTSTAAKVSQLMGEKDATIEQIKDPHGRRFPPIPAWCILIERTIGSKAIAGEVALVLSLKMGIGNSMHKVDATETPAQFCLRVCESREAFDTTSTVCDVTLPSLLQLFINGLPQSLKEVYNNQRLSLQLGNKTTEERLAAVASVVDNAWTQMHADKVQSAESDLRKHGPSIKERSSYNPPSGQSQTGGANQRHQQPSSGNSDSRYRPQRGTYQTFTTITEGEKKKDSSDAVTLTTLTKPNEQPMPPTGTPNDHSGKYAGSAYFGIKPRNGGRPSPLDPASSAGRGGRGSSSYQSSGGRGSSDRRERDNEPQRFRSIDRNNPPRSPYKDRNGSDRPQPNCNFCGVDGHKEPDCEHKKRAIASLRLGMNNIHNSHSNSNEQHRKVSWDPSANPGSSSLRPQNDGWRNRQHQVTATTLTHDEEDDLYWSSNVNSHMTLVNIGDEEDSQLQSGASQATVSNSMEYDCNEDLLYMPLFSFLANLQFKPLRDSNYDVTFDMIDYLIRGIKAQAHLYKLQEAIDQQMFYEVVDPSLVDQQYGAFKDLMAKIEDKVTLHKSSAHLFSSAYEFIRSDIHSELIFMLRVACQTVVEIAKLRIHELFTLGEIHELGGDTSSATTGFWLKRPDWILSWEYISSRNTLREICTNQGLLYSLSLIKKVWEPSSSIPATEESESNDDRVAESVSALNLVSLGESSSVKHITRYDDDSESNSDFRYDSEYWSHFQELSEHAADFHDIEEQPAPDSEDPPTLFSCMSVIDGEDGVEDEATSEETDEDENNQLAPSIEHFFGPYNDWDIRTPLGVGFLTNTIAALRACAQELRLIDRTWKDFERLNQLVRLQARVVQPSNRQVIRPQDWEFEHKASLTYIWSSLKSSAELHLRELAEGRLTEYMDDRGDSIFFSHGNVHGSALSKLTRFYPWRPQRYLKEQDAMPPKDRITSFIKNLITEEEVSRVDIYDHIELLFTPSYLLRKKTERKRLHALLAAFVSEAESMATEARLNKDSDMVGLKNAIIQSVTNIFFWIEGNVRKKGENIVEPWHWPTQCAAWLKSAHTSFKSLFKLECKAGVISLSTTIELVNPHPYDLTGEVLALSNSSITPKRAEEALAWLWDVYHLLETDKLLSTQPFADTLNYLVKADSGRDWTVRSGVFKSLFKNILDDIIELEDKDLCLKMVGSPSGNPALTFDSKWDGYYIMAEAVQLIQIAADFRLKELFADQDSSFWDRRLRHQGLRSSLLKTLQWEDVSPEYVSFRVQEVSGKSELELILPFLSNCIIESTSSDSAECEELRTRQREHMEWRQTKFKCASFNPDKDFRSTRRSSILDWEKRETSPTQCKSPGSSSLPVLSTISQTSVASEEVQVLNQMEINLNKLEEFKARDPYYFNRPSYNYIIQRMNHLEEDRTAKGKALAIKHLPYFESLVPDFTKYYNVLRSPTVTSTIIKWDDNTTLAWNTIIKLFSEALSGADGLVIVDKLWPDQRKVQGVTLNPPRSRERHAGRKPSFVAKLSEWMDEYWPLSMELEEGTMEKPATYPQLQSALDKLEAHQMIIGFGPWHTCPSGRFNVLSEPLYTLLAQSKNERPWEPVQETAFKHLIAKIRDVLWADVYALEREEAELVSYAHRRQPSTPEHFNNATLLTVLSSSNNADDMDTDDEKWGCRSIGSGSESDLCCFSTIYDHGANYKEARRFPESYAPSQPFEATQLSKHIASRTPASPRPQSFTTQPVSLPPSEEEYVENKARRARLRYLSQPSDPTKCVGINVNGTIHTDFRVLLDDASNAHLISRSLAERLGIPIKESSQKLTTMTQKGLSTSGETDLIELVYAPSSAAPLSVWTKFIIIDPVNSLQGVYDLLVGNADSQEFKATICGLTDSYTIRPDFKQMGRASREITLPTEWQRPFKLKARKGPARS